MSAREQELEAELAQWKLIAAALKLEGENAGEFDRGWQAALASFWHCSFEDKRLADAEWDKLYARLEGCERELEKLRRERDAETDAGQEGRQGGAGGASGPV